MVAASRPPLVGGCSMNKKAKILATGCIVAAAVVDDGDVVIS